MQNDWFSVWFGSKYYPILYKNRDDHEAFRFISRVVEDLELEEGMRVLDLACGRGRHARYLNKLNLDVLGLDISEESIKDAKKYENRSLSFKVHDMRDPFPVNNLNVVCNLFTSFGYFNDTNSNLSVLHNINQSLVKGGVLVLDYLNAYKVIEQLVREEEKLINGVKFKIKRYIKDHRIFKEIEIFDENYHETFTEKVQAIDLETFEKLLNIAGFRIYQLWGEYDASPFSKIDSSRLIIFSQKI